MEILVVVGASDPPSECGGFTKTLGDQRGKQQSTEFRTTNSHSLPPSDALGRRPSGFSQRSEAARVYTNPATQTNSPIFSSCARTSVILLFVGVFNPMDWAMRQRPPSECEGFTKTLGNQEGIGKVRNPARQTPFLFSQSRRTVACFATVA